MGGATISDSDPNIDAVRRAAAHWFSLREAGGMSAAQEMQFTQWLAESPTHERELVRAEAIWEALGSASYSGRRASRDPVRRLRNWAGAALAASIAVTLVVGLDVPTRLQADVRTGTGVRQMVKLADGSSVLLNTDSAIAIDSPNGRTLRLLKGEAAFTVAPDKRHPFTVTANRGTTTALGTRFIVSRSDDGAQVTVTEHSVRVSVGDHAGVIREGETLGYHDARLGHAQSVTIADADAWTRGRMRVVNRPLGEVLHELNRYHVGYIGVWDKDLAQRPVSGVFNIDDPAGAIDVIQQTLGISSTRLTDSVIVLHS